MDLVNDILMDHSWDPLIIVFTHKEDLIPEQLLKEYKPPGLSKDLAVEFTVNHHYNFLQSYQKYRGGSIRSDGTIFHR